jgi:glycosyltransferase involved in cell wall biosynthesis
MAAGCPVVAANSGGIPDIVTDGVNGYLFEPNNPNSAIEACHKVLKTTATEREVLRQKARLEAERWGWAAATVQLKSYYHAVLNSDLLSSVA